MSAEAAATTAANLTLSTNGLTLILPPVKIGIGATFNIVISGNNNTVMCGGGSQTCVVNGAAAAVTNLIQITGNNNVIEGLQILGGRCGNNPCSGSAGSAANSENSIDITSAASGNRVLRNLITDSGKHGILIQNASNNLIRDNTIFRAYNEAILVNTSASGNSSVNNEIASNLVEDSNIQPVTDGSIGVSCSGTCPAGGTDGTDIHDNVVTFLNFGATICTHTANMGTINDTGCKEGIQSTDQAWSTNEHDNFVQNSQNEGFVNSGNGGSTTNNRCENCGSLGAGAGPFMFSYGSNAAATVGNFTMVGNKATSSLSTQVGYCASIQDENGFSVAVTYENITVANNTCSGQPGSGGFNNGVRFFRSSTTDTLTISNVRFVGNTASDGVVSPLTLTYGTGTTGVVRVVGNGFNTSTDTAPVASNIVTFDANLQPEADSGTPLSSLAPVASPTFTGIVTMPTNNSCRVTAGDITLSTSATNICSFSLPAVAKPWAWQCQIPWAVTAGTTPTLSIGVNASQTPTGTTNASAEIKTTNTNTATEATVSLSAFGSRQRTDEPDPNHLIYCVSLVHLGYAAGLRHGGYVRHNDERSRNRFCGGGEERCYLLVILKGSNNSAG